MGVDCMPHQNKNTIFIWGKLRCRKIYPSIERWVVEFRIERSRSHITRVVCAVWRGSVVWRVVWEGVTDSVCDVCGVYTQTQMGLAAHTPKYWQWKLPGLGIIGIQFFLAFVWIHISKCHN